MEVIQVPARPAFRSFYTVAGRLLFVESIDLRLGNLIERLYAGWQLTPVSFPQRSPDIRINFFCGDTPPQIPGNLKRFEVAEGGQCYNGDGGFYLTLGNSLIHLQNGDPVIVDIWIDKVPGPGDAVLARVTSFAVCAALRRYGMFELHSAGMVHPRSEKGVLIIGPSGSGKSTLALQLATAGWPYLSDDELLLSLVEDEVEARGFRSFFAVNHGDSRAKVCFEPETSLRRPRAVPGQLLFIRLTGDEKTELNRLTQVEAMTRLLRACPWATYDTSIAGVNLEVLSRLAQQARAFDLLAGRDLLEPGYASTVLSNTFELKAGG